MDTDADRACISVHPAFEGPIVNQEQMTDLICGKKVTGRMSIVWVLYWYVSGCECVELSVRWIVVVKVEPYAF